MVRENFRIAVANVRTR